MFSLLASPGTAGGQDDAPDWPEGTQYEPEPYTPGEVVPAPHFEDEREDADDDEFRDPYGAAIETPTTNQFSSQVRYVLERIEVTGNTRTKSRLIRKFVPLEPGQFLDPESPDLVATEWRLMGTGWFDRVDIRLERGEKSAIVKRRLQEASRETGIKVRSSWEDKTQRALLWKRTAKR